MRGTNAGPDPMKVVAAWPGVALKFPSPAARDAAVAAGLYDPHNITAWSILVHGNRMFIFCPSLYRGTYSTVNFVYLNETSISKPAEMRPYFPPGHSITSVFRGALSCHDRHMYFVDDGVESYFDRKLRHHPPRLFRVHLPSDRLELVYTLPAACYREDSLFANLAVDLCPPGAAGAVYLADMSQYAVVVIDLETNVCHRVRHPYFVMDPFSAFLHTSAGYNYTFLADGVAALALSPRRPRSRERTLYFACSGGRHMFSVSTETLRNSSLSADTARFTVLGYKGDRSQSNNLVYIDSGALLYATTQDNTLYCWNTREELTPRTQKAVMRDDSWFRTPNDLQADCGGAVWALANNWVAVGSRGAGATGGSDVVVLWGRAGDLAAACAAPAHRRWGDTCGAAGSTPNTHDPTTNEYSTLNIQYLTPNTRYQTSNIQYSKLNPTLNTKQPTYPIPYTQ